MDKNHQIEYVAFFIEIQSLLLTVSWSPDGILAA